MVALGLCLYHGVPLAYDKELAYRLALAYHGQTAMVDAMFGRVAEALASSAASQNTFTFFTSDHGEMHLEHRMVERRTGPDTTEIQFTAFEFGQQVYESSVLYARGAVGSDGGGQDAGRALVEALASSLAGNDYEAFKSLTCLGMGKEDFKQFMQENPDRKVLRVWDSAKDDFKAELKVEVREAFDLAQRGARAFDWSQAEVRSLNWEQEGGGDVKATLVSGSLGALIKLDDCFMTPMGLLTFEAPVGGVMPVERLPRDF